MTAVAVQLRILEPTADLGEEPRLAVEGTMLFGEAYAAAPDAEALHMGAALPSIPAPEDFYPQALFHGPLFRAVKEIRRAGENGMEAVLEMPLTQTLLPEPNRRPVSDQPRSSGRGRAGGRSLGYCRFGVDFRNLSGKDRMKSPFMLPSRDLAGRFFVASTPRLEGDARLSSDIQLLAPDGTLLAQLRGMHHNRARVPKILHQFRGSREIRLSHAVAGAPWSPGCLWQGGL